jgi:hypothetical protein
MGTVTLSRKVELVTAPDLPQAEEQCKGNGVARGKRRNPGVTDALATRRENVSQAFERQDKLTSSPIAGLRTGESREQITGRA